MRLPRLRPGRPLHRQVYESLRQAILDGKLEPGERLPATRVLCADLGISRNAVLQAYDQLLAEGYVVGKQGAGTFVAEPLPEALLRVSRHPRRTPGSRPRAVQLSRYGRHARRASVGWRPRDPRLRIDFRYGEVEPDRAAMAAWARLLALHARHPPTRYGPTEGLPELRNALASHLEQSRGLCLDDHELIVVNGSQQALDLVTRVLVDPGDGVVLEEPTYQGARAVFEAAFAKLYPVAVDEQGIDPARFPDPVNPRLVYVTPSHQFPTGAVLPLGRRLSLLQWAARHDAYVLEDDYDSEYRYGGRPIEAVQGLDSGRRTIYVGTLSKILFPALRIGYLVLPRELVEPVVKAKWLADRHTPTLSQAVLADFLKTGQFERHLRATRRRNGERQKVLRDALAKHFGDEIRHSAHAAGIHLFVEFPGMAAAQADEWAEAAAKLGVGIYPAGSYYARRPRHATLILGFAGLRDRQIEDGIRKMARCRPLTRRS